MIQNKPLNTEKILLKGVIASLAEGENMYNSTIWDVLKGNNKRTMVEEIENHLSIYGKYQQEALITKALQGLYPLRKEIIIKIIEEELQPGQYRKFCELRDYIRASFEKLRVKDASLDFKLEIDGKAIERTSEVMMLLESKLLQDISDSATMHNVINSCDNIDDFILCTTYCIDHYNDTIPYNMLYNAVYRLLSPLSLYKQKQSKGYSTYMDKIGDIVLSAIKKYNYTKIESSALAILLDYGSYTYSEKYRHGRDDFDTRDITVTSTFRQQVNEYFASKQ